MFYSLLSLKMRLPHLCFSFDEPKKGKAEPQTAINEQKSAKLLGTSPFVKRHNVESTDDPLR
jgi:hypothetical protein